MAATDVKSAQPEVRESSGKRIPPIEHRFKPGVSGNPGGVPKHDISSEIAGLVFEGMGPQERKKAIKTLRKIMLTNPKMFQVLADRKYGKVPQTINIEGELTIANRVADRLREARKRLGDDPIE